MSDIKIDLSYLDEVAGGNAEFIIEMIDIFLQQTPGYVSGLNGAIAEKDWKRIAEIAHKIKPTLTFMGLNDEQVQMANIEHQAREQKAYEEIVAVFDKLNSLFPSIYIALENKKVELAENT